MYAIIWEFVVRKDRIREFVAVYQSDGDWARLFRLAEGFEGTQLLSATDDAERFLTIDRWRSVDHFTGFREQFGEQYRALDARLEGLTVSERKLGTFVTGPAACEDERQDVVSG